MPLSEPEAGALIVLKLSPSGGWRGEPDIVIRCSWCGYRCARTALTVANAVALECGMLGGL